MTHPTRDALEIAIADANRGHRISEWEDVAARLGLAARKYIEHVDEVRGKGVADNYTQNPALKPAALALDSNVKTSMAERLVSGVLQEWLDLFLQKNRKYRAVGDGLGAKGVFPDVWRKVGVLKARLWEGDDAGSGEPTTEVIDDLIGHLFLMRDMLAQPVEPPTFSPGRVMALDEYHGDEHIISGDPAYRRGMQMPRPVKDSPQG